MPPKTGKTAAKSAPKVKAKGKSKGKTATPTPAKKVQASQWHVETEGVPFLVAEI